MKSKKRSFYQSRIESLKSQNETEFQTIKELLSPASYEKLKKAQCALPQVTPHRNKLWDFRTKQELLQEKRQRADARSARRDAQIIMLAKSKELIEPSEKKRQNVGRLKKAKVVPERTAVRDAEAELRGILDEIEKDAGKPQSTSTTMKHKSWSFKVESKELVLSDGHALDDQESFEPWEPKVELLEEDDPSETNSSNQSGLEEFEKDPKGVNELPVSYLSVVELKNDSAGVGFSGHPQIVRLSAVPSGAEGVCELVKVENSTELPYFPANQLSNFYILN